MQIVPLKSESTTYRHNEPLILESGHTLQDLCIHYTTYGEINKDQSNVVWVFHALTANSDPMEWWSGLVGDQQLFDPEKHFIICANMLGSCYGSTEPQDFNFPVITVKDMVKAHRILQKQLGIQRIKVGIGGSMGGQQLLEWACQAPDLFELIVPIATNAVHSAWGIAFNEAQRMALNNTDITKGLEAARAIAMLSYRHYRTYEDTQTDTDGRSDHFAASSYQQYQGKKLSERFSPYSYYFLSKAMDSQRVGKREETLEDALASIESKAIVIGVDSDILFPPQEQSFIAKHIPNGSFHAIESLYGHDGFLIETEQIAKILADHI